MAFDFRKYQAFDPGIDKSDRRWPNKKITHAPRWAAVDLRDGNQALVKPMTVDQKQIMFDLLVKIGMKEIEVGFPSASQVDFDFVRQLIEQDRVPDDVSIQVLTQARDELIERTFESLCDAKNAIMHVYNAIAPVWRERVFNVDRAGCIALARHAAEKVRNEATKYPQTNWSFEYSPETFSQAEPDFAVDVIDAVTSVWQPEKGQKMIVNMPTTVEVATPNVFADQMEWVLDRLAHRDHICASVHPHNDRGTGVATAELAVLAGVDRIEGTLMGNGERTGNVDLINIAMNLYSQGVDPELDFSNMGEIAETVAEITDIPTHPRHPWVGEFVFAAFSGSHQDAIRKCLNQYEPDSQWDIAYLPIDPQDVGRDYEEVIRVNSQSGKGGVTHVLERDYGVSLPRWLQQEFAKVIQLKAEQSSSEVTAADIVALFEKRYLAVPEGFRLRRHDVQNADKGVAVNVTIGEQERVVLQGKGTHVVNAVANALENSTGVTVAVTAADQCAIHDESGNAVMAFVSLAVQGAENTAVARGATSIEARLQAALSAAGGVQGVASKLAPHRSTDAA